MVQCLLACPAAVSLSYSKVSWSAGQLMAAFSVSKIRLYTDAQQIVVATLSQVLHARAYVMQR